MRSTCVLFRRHEKNKGVAPRWDIWQNKYDAWVHLKRMSKLAGTGYYIPPNWYQHFRMFPPISHNFHEERTLNPYANSEPTQLDMELDEGRQKLRQELGMKSRSLAAAGNRYFSQFWIQKPLDTMERKYYDLTSNKKLSHREAVDMLLKEHQKERQTRRRVQLIQAEQAKQSGKYITMREATALMSLLHHTHSLPGAQAAESLANTIQQQSIDAPLKSARFALASNSQRSGSSSSDGINVTPDESEPEVFDVLSDGNDSMSTLRETATDGTGEADWYSGVTSAIPAPRAPQRQTS